MRFEYPILLLSLVLAPVMVLLFMALLRWKKTTIGKIGDEKLIRQLIAGYSPKKFLWKFILVLTAFVLTGLGLANLQTPRQTEQVQRQGVDVMIVMDVSKSMMARDLQPSRMERARQLASKLIDKLHNDRVGLILFAGRAYVQMPVTTDHAAAKMYVHSASPESVPTQGTVIGEALQVAMNAFGETDKKFKTIVLMTDGEDHDDQAMPMATKLAEQGVLLHTIGIGTEEGATLTDPETMEQKRDQQGNVVISRLNEQMLRDIAQTAHGQYMHLEDTDETVDAMLAQIDAMEKKAIADPSTIRYRSFFQWFIAAALILLLVDFFLSERKKMAGR